MIAAFNSFPALNFGTVVAAMLIDSPVRGLRPILAARSDVEKVPNPTRVTLSFFVSAAVMFEVTEFSAFSASTFVNPLSVAIAAISSCLFI